MESRTRSRSTQQIGGTVYRVEDDVVYEMGTKTYISPGLDCFDYWRKKRRSDGLLPVSDFEISKVERFPLNMSRSDTGAFRFRQYELDNTSGTPSHQGSLLAPRGSSLRNSENAVYVQELLARTNPFRSEYSVPVAIKEMAEVVSMFKIVGESILQFIGSSYLNFKFGWMTFFDDLRTLSKITDSIRSRMKEFKSLTRHGGLRRKVHLHSGSTGNTGSLSTVHSTWGVIVKSQYRRETSIRVYGTVRWRAKPGFEAYIDQLDLFAEAVRQVFDLETIDAATAWQMLPFSWLLDYFVNLSDFLEGQEGLLDIEPYDICIMRDVSTRYTMMNTSTNNGGITFGGSGVFTLSTKCRDVCSRGTFPAVRTGLLSSNQFLTIAALLAVLRKL